MNKISFTFFIGLASAILFVGSAQSKTLLVKLEGAPALSKSSKTMMQTGIASIDAVLLQWQVQKVRPLFSQNISQQINQPASWVVVDLADDVSEGDVLRELRQTQGVITAQENRAFKLNFVPNDSLYEKQYALQKIKAESGWDIQRGSKDVLVAVIDTGIDYNHPDMRDNLWLNAGEDVNGNGRVDEQDFNGVDDDGNGFIDDVRGWDFTDAPNYPSAGDYLVRDNDPMDEHGHGTGVSGLIAATANNTLGIAGLAHNCRVMALRAFNAGGYGEEDDAASAILYAVANGAQIINMSFGDVFVSQVLEDVIDYALQQGVVLVASSGNSSTDQIHYPSGFWQTISVGATDSDDALAGYSNYGPTVDLVAPGSDVLSLDIDGGYHSWNGTSFSAPYVSAAAALLLSENPGLTPEAVRSILINSVDDLGEPGWDDRFGAGRLNVLKLLMQDHHTLAAITTPVLDAGFSTAPVEIHGSAWSPRFDSYTLWWGESANPTSWNKIGETYEEPVIDGFLGDWLELPEHEGEYSIKLAVVDKDNVETVQATRIFLDWSPPVVESLEFAPMLHGDMYSVLLDVKTDDLCEGSLYYSTDNSNFIEAPLTYRTTDLRYNLTQQEASGSLKAWVRLVNSAGLETIDDNNGVYYDIDLNKPQIDVTAFSRTDLSLPFGRLLGTPADFNNNGITEIIASVSNDGAIGPVSFFEFDGLTVQEVFSLSDARIPRDIGDSDNDGKMELLCGFGFNSYLYEATEPGGFPSENIVSWIGDGATQYWASRFSDLDQDGKGEVIMRVVRSQDDGGTDQFELFERTGDNEHEFIASFENPTPGENFNGVPHCQTADFDGDGAMEILLGDGDGDIYIYENSGDNSFVATWQNSLPLLDSIGFLAAGDFDGDGVQEFAAGCHSDPNLNTEHDYDARHWTYRIYDTIGDNNFQQVAEWRFFGFESTRDFLSSVSAGDVDEDGDDELFISVYPDFYVVDVINNAYEVIYHHAPVQTSAVFVADTDMSGSPEFWIGDGEQLFAIESVGVNTGPATPVSLIAQPLNTASVKLSWRAVSGAENYRIYRGPSSDSLVYFAEASVNSFVDETVQRDQLYFYAVKTVDAQKSPSESRLSQIVSARPGEPPVLVQARQETATSIRLYFSETMNSSVRVASNYLVNKEVGRPTSVGHDKSGREVLLTFSAPLASGEYTVTCSNLQDIDNTPMQDSENSVVFSMSEQVRGPYILSAEYISDERIDLFFNQALDPISAQTTQNYTVNGDFIIERAELTGEEQQVVQLFSQRLFEKNTSGDTLIIQAYNVKNSQGAVLNHGRGDAAQVVLPGGKTEQLSVFPNPIVLGKTAVVTFANVKENDEVHIISVRGRRVRTLRKNGGDGDLMWDVRNSSGDYVASGVYIFRLFREQGDRVGKLAVLR